MKCNTISLLLALVSVSVAPAFAQQPSGTIAYIRAGKTPGDEIRTIRPDGGGDRPLWRIPAVISTGVTGLAWSPNGKEIAFSSDQDAAQSVYDSNIFVIHADGTGLRRLTDPPGTSELAKYPKGKVVVTVQNYLSNVSPFLVYVSGSAAPKTAVVSGGRTTLTFDSVADFGDRPHPVVAIFGIHRWLIPGAVVHAGKTVNAGTLNLTGSGMRDFGLSGPTWSRDGKKVGCILGDGAELMWVPPIPVPGAVPANPLIGGSEHIEATTYDLGHTPATENELLYGGGVDNHAFRRTRIGSGQRGEALVEYSDTEGAGLVSWLPDGSGFLFSKIDFSQNSANIYRYDFATKKTTQLTHLEGEAALLFSPSPDGRWIVFDRRRLGDTTTPPDLWIMRADGSGMKLLVKNGAAPAWSPS